MHEQKRPTLLEEMRQDEQKTAVNGGLMISDLIIGLGALVIGILLIVEGIRGIKRSK